MSQDMPPACDYVVAFVDLLGQKDAMRDRHLPLDQNEALKVIKNSVGKVLGTQKHFQEFITGFTSRSGIYSNLPEYIQKVLPDMAPGELKWQRFSDGFVIYIPLGAGQVKSPANSILGLLMATGMHCLIGLAAKSPLRVGIDVAWAVELEPNEIYGAAIAYAHHLESKVAQWPRVVVGEGLTDYLQHYVDSASADLSGQARRLVASTCLRFLAQDSDGVKILDYLGPSYQRAAGNAIQQDVLEKANVFIREQLSYWEFCEDQEMSRRYREVANYFRSRELRSTVQRA